MTKKIERAPAKINLCLHVTGRRDDGYHRLESLVVFSDAADVLTLRPASGFSLSVSGRFSGVLSSGNDNLVSRAIDAVACHQKKHPDFSLHLEKNLPVGAGIGGGSADAAAALRLIQGVWGLPDALIGGIAPALGADVPVCLASSAQMMRGIGDIVTPLPGMPMIPCVLVWPDVFCDTRIVFQNLNGAFGAPLPPLPESGWTDSRLIKYLWHCRNDLETPAISLFPVIKTALEILRAQDGVRIAGMSGSGSTCFSLFHTSAQAHMAANVIQKKYPAWWVHAGYINSQSI